MMYPISVKRAWMDTELIISTNVKTAKTITADYAQQITLFVQPVLKATDLTEMFVNNA